MVGISQAAKDSHDKPTAGDQAVGQIIGFAASRASMGLGTVFSMIGGAARVDSAHRNAIEVMEKAGMPGFEVKDVKIGGRDFKIYVDASPNAYGQKPDVLVHPQPHFNSDDPDSHKRELQQAKRDAVLTAQDEVSDFIGARGEDAYHNKIMNYLGDDFIDDSARHYTQLNDEYLRKREATINGTGPSSPNMD